MKIAIVASASNYGFIPGIQQKLIELGHIVTTPLELEKDVKKENYTSISHWKNKLIIQYMEVIKINDVLLVVNLEKNGIKNYIGGNVLLEMGFTTAFGKKIFLYNDIPEVQYKDEIEGLLPIVINQQLDRIK
ncbi:hypothetical protein KBD45_06225 [Candidatus Dojkabacteria bacterium]|nr:hypothetical protein [Candidatus Dojkabacteria bacterium]